MDRKKVANALTIAAIILITAMLILFALVRNSPPGEVCDNMIDDDGNGRVDCADDECSSWPACFPVPVNN